MLFRSGGHAQACGLSIKRENIKNFRQKLNQPGEFHPNLLQGADLSIDAEVETGHIGEPFLKELGRMMPFGPGNPKPLFVSKKLKVRGDVKKRGKDTLQCWMTDGVGKNTFEVIGFRSYSRWISQGKEKSAVDIVYQPALKTFNGITSIQLELEDWKLTPPVSDV